MPRQGLFHFRWAHAVTTDVRKKRAEPEAEPRAARARRRSALAVAFETDANRYNRTWRLACGTVVGFRVGCALSPVSCMAEERSEATVH